MGGEQGLHLGVKLAIIPAGRGDEPTTIGTALVQRLVKALIGSLPGSAVPLSGFPRAQHYARTAGRKGHAGRAPDSAVPAGDQDRLALHFGSIAEASGATYMTSGAPC